MYPRIFINPRRAHEYTDVVFTPTTYCDSLLAPPTLLNIFDQGVAQGCSLSPILFSVFINDLLKEVEQAELGIQLSSGKTFGGMLFADDFVGVSDSKESLQKLIDVVYSYCSKWRLRANVIKSAVMVFSKDAVNGCWKWGKHSLPKVSSYSYLGIDFSSNGAWDMPGFLSGGGGGEHLPPLGSLSPPLGTGRFAC